MTSLLWNIVVIITFLAYSQNALNTPVIRCVLNLVKRGVVQGSFCLLWREQALADGKAESAIHPTRCKADYLAGLLIVYLVVC
ncbi:MAG: hypothetical protein DYG89_02440 [Caldilinea sp. CFX5]|nr:hypothetical protein [Caldilinea sp. CFX5]